MMKKTIKTKTEKTPAAIKPDVAKAPKTVLVLRTCKADMSSPSSDANGFKWPESGAVSAPDWSPVALCGHGLHGALWGDGAGDLFCWLPDAKWLVVEVLESEIVDLGGKVKFPRGTVVFCGTRNNATNYIASRAPKAENVIGLISSVGDFEERKGADGVTLSGGHKASLSGGYGATVSGGEGATVSGGEGATVSGGARATVSGGYGATVSGGARATVSGGARATVSGGEGAIITCQWWDGKRYRLALGYVGEDGIKPETKYKVVNGKFEEIK